MKRIPLRISTSVLLATAAVAAGTVGNLDPLTVVLQRQSGSSWVTVATGLGEAQYFCAGTSPRTYRMGSRPAVTVTLNCS
jgi:hypothetical protein